MTVIVLKYVSRLERKLSVDVEKFALSLIENGGGDLFNFDA